MTAKSPTTLLVVCLQPEDGSAALTPLAATPMTVTAEHDPRNNRDLKNDRMELPEGVG
jgi:hypothetical protein